MEKIKTLSELPISFIPSCPDHKFIGHSRDSSLSASDKQTDLADHHLHLHYFNFEFGLL